MPEGKPATVFNPPEKSRVYIFPNDEKVTLENVTELMVSNSGNHRLKTQDGKHHIIPVGWLHIELEIDNWTV